jgi:tetratricopeptide (TPR) repeat protein
MGLLVALVLLGSGPDPALVEAKQHFAVARAAYDAGRFDDALAAFQAAYAKKPIPAFLFNVGQCERQLGHYDRAIFFFERYLESSPNLDDEGRRVVTELIVEARARHDSERASQAEVSKAVALETLKIGEARDAASRSAAEAAEAKQAAREAAALAARTPPPAPAAVPASDEAPWGIVSIGLGAVAVVAAAAVGIAVWASAQPSLGVVDGRTGAAP